MAQWVKDPSLPLQQLGSLLWLKIDPWPRNIHILWVRQKKKKKKKKKKKGNICISFLEEKKTITLKPQLNLPDDIVTICVVFTT